MVPRITQSMCYPLEISFRTQGHLDVDPSRDATAEYTSTSTPPLVLFVVFVTALCLSSHTENSTGCSRRTEGHYPANHVAPHPSRRAVPVPSRLHVSAPRECDEGCSGTCPSVLLCESVLTPEAREMQGVSGRHATSRNGKRLGRTVQAIIEGVCVYARWGSSAAQVATSPVYTPQHRSVSTLTNEDTGCSSRAQSHLGLKRHRRRHGCWPRPSARTVSCIV